MSYNRRAKREEARKSNKAIHEQKLRTQHFSNICIEFSAILLNNNFDMDSEAVNNSFDKYNKEWKQYARNQINKYPLIYSKPKTRRNLIDGFEVFVNKYIDNHVKPMQDLKESVIELANDPAIKPGLIKELEERKYGSVMGDPIENEKDMEWYDYTIREIKSALAAAGVVSLARTIKGLTPVVKNLDEDQLRSFNAILGLL
jgi:hypothetical protein